MLANTGGHGAGRLQQYDSHRMKPPAMVSGRQGKVKRPKGMVRNQYGPIQNCLDPGPSSGCHHHSAFQRRLGLLSST